MSVLYKRARDALREQQGRAFFTSRTLALSVSGTHPAGILEKKSGSAASYRGHETSSKSEGHARSELIVQAVTACLPGSRTMQHMYMTNAVPVRNVNRAILNTPYTLHSSQGYTCGAECGSRQIRPMHRQASVLFDQRE